jgi:isoleucyl-tRNA synthetase
MDRDELNGTLIASSTIIAASSKYDGVSITDKYRTEISPDLSVIFAPAPGTKCDRCWRVLEEVGQSTAHPTLCRRCEAVVA